ncbi:unnamed protein product [Lupinus luteus]|uniref:Uncharacterized protein n=1 Tax=Lupinus luteus TaxID=3873 RepID=A0AAV1YDR3_LUPLU
MRIILNDKNKNNEDLPNDNEGSLKKGPWTPDEDAILINYVNKYGEGNWNAVQKNSGLLRCGKSCRLRWVNHLRPNLKKGSFSLEEERIIVELHAKHGNKWARMASKLPGRTDNEIKNFWNTRIKRCERAGLPIYPPDVIHEATLYHLQEERYFDKPYTNNNNNNNNNSPLPFSLQLPSLFSSSSYPNKVNNSNPYSALNPPQNKQPISLYASSSSSSNLLNNQSFVVPNNSDSHGYNYSSGSFNYNNGFLANSMLPPLVPSSVSSSQTPSDSVNNENYDIAPNSSQGNSGLLDALVVEGQSLSRNNKSRSEDSTVAVAETAEKSSNKRKSVVLEENAKEGGTSSVHVEPALKKKKKKNNGDNNNETLKGKKEIAKEPLDVDETVWDDDLFSLLTYFPIAMPMPDWYRKEDQSKSPNLQTQPNAPPHAPTKDMDEKLY